MSLVSSLPGGLRPKLWQIDSKNQIIQRIQDNLHFTILNDDIGSGKTITSLLVIKELILKNPNDRFIILVTNNITKQWMDTLDKYFPEIYYILIAKHVEYTARVKKDHPPNIIITTSFVYFHTLEIIKNNYNLEEFKYLFIDEYESFNIDEIITLIKPIINKGFVKSDETNEERIEFMDSQLFNKFDNILLFFKHILFISSTIFDSENKNNSDIYIKQHKIMTILINMFLYDKKYNASKIIKDFINNFIHKDIVKLPIKLQYKIDKLVNFNDYKILISPHMSEFQKKIKYMKNNIVEIVYESNYIDLRLKNNKSTFTICPLCYIETNGLIESKCCSSILCYDCFLIYQKCFICSKVFDSTRGNYNLINIEQAVKVSDITNFDWIISRPTHEYLINMNYILNEIFKRSMNASVIIYFKNKQISISEKQMLLNLNCINFLIPIATNKIKFLKGGMFERSKIIELFNTNQINILFANIYFDCSGICLENATDVIYIDNYGDKYEQSIGRIIRMNRPEDKILYKHLYNTIK